MQPLIPFRRLGGRRVVGRLDWNGHAVGAANNGVAGSQVTSGKDAVASKTLEGRGRNPDAACLDACQR